MMKKIAIILVLALIFISCGKKGDKPEALLDEMVNISKNFTEEINNSDTADKVAKALNNYADKMEEFMPRWKKVTEKFPEFKTMNGNKMPEAFKKYEEKLKNMTQKMTAAFIKIAPHMKDPKVVEAQKRFMKIGQMK